MATIIDAIQTLGVATARQLAARLGVSQPTVSRLVAAHSDRIARVGAGRTTRYVLRESMARVESPVPVYRILPSGTVARLDHLEPASNGRFLFLDQLFDDLPWMIWDARPQGFIGRMFARGATDLNLPRSLSDWTTEDILVALTRRGEDVVGDLVLGRESLDRLIDIAPLDVSRDDYPDLAQRTIQGEAPGSSAGGEQPKFAARVDGTAVIVKFTAPVTDSVAQRQADLLICEDVALNVLRDHGEPAAVSRLIEGNRIMLETARFDRTPKGRRALVSGTAVDAQFVGSGDWIGLANGLARQGLIATADAARIRLWRTFGLLIGNSDMHLGNLSFFTEDYAKFSLAPAYDMLPMLFAPSSTGELVQRSLEVRISALDPHAFRFAAEMAEEFWIRVQCRVSSDFKAIVDDALRELDLVKERMAKLL